MWIVSTPETIRRRWFKNGSEVSSGTASVRFARNNAGTIQYLQADDSWSTSSATRSLSFTVGAGWILSFTPLSSMAGYNIVAEATHSDSTLPILTEEHYVTVYDLDDAALARDGATVRGK